jgi:hypothetical protein
VIDFVVNNWAQHEDMRNLIEKEKEETKRRLKSYNELGDWKTNVGPKWKAQNESEIVTPLPPSRPGSIENSRQRVDSVDTPDNFRLSNID